MTGGDPDQLAHSIARAARSLAASERKAFVSSKCGADSKLQARVEALIKQGFSDERSPDSAARQLVTGGALDMFGAKAQSVTAHEPGLIGQRIGSYRIRERIAVGGMGEVYRAERIDGSFDREVAIKVTGTSSLNEEFRRRFQHEQRILASLHHQGITQLFDAGITDGGLPFIVMELVDGQPIDEYCRRRELSPNAIVDLLLQIADAVSFAHARLVVHRDIKPSNVLVTEAGEVKLLDFGIARLLESDAVAATELRPLSPRYASPEQLLGREITIASDIYQIGLLMVELLSGSPARSETNLSDEIMRAVEQRPFPLRETADRNLPNELRQIAEQCLMNEPEERYADVNALHRDLANYQAGYPVAAVGETSLYRLRKFLKRHGRALAHGTVAALLLGTSVQLVNWLAASPVCPRPSEQMSGIWDAGIRAAVVSSIGDLGIPAATKTAATLVERLDQYVEGWLDMHQSACIANRVEASQSDAMFDRRMMCLEDRRYEVQALSQTLQSPSESTLLRTPELLSTLEPLQRCADLEAMASTVPPPGTAVADDVNRVKQQLANVTTDFAEGDLVSASTRLEALQPTASKTGYAPLLAEIAILAARIESMSSDPNSKETFRNAVTLAALARDDFLLATAWIEFAYHTAKYLELVPDAQELLFNARSAVLRAGQNSVAAVDLANTEGAVAYLDGDLDQALQHFHHARTLAERVAPERVPQIEANLAGMYRQRGELEQSRKFALRALRDIEERYGEGSLPALLATEDLAKISQELGDHQAAIDYLVPLIDALEWARGGPSLEIAMFNLDLGWSLKELNRLEDAAAAMRTTIRILNDLRLIDSNAAAYAHNNIGDLYMYMEDYARSELHLKRALEIWSKADGNPRKALPLTNLGLLMNRTGEHHDALEYCREALAIDENALGPDHFELAYALTCIGKALLELDRPDEAVEPLRRAVALRTRFDTYEHGWSRFLLGQALIASGRPLEGRERIDEAQKLFDASPSPDPYIARAVGQ